MKKSILTDLQTELVSFSKVWSYKPNKVISDWDGTYCEVISGEKKYIRPNDKSYDFTFELLPNNPLGLSLDSIGIYIIYDEISCVYVGLTEGNIDQRFDAHISKLTAKNKHHHPKKWREYVKIRYEKKGEKFYDLEEFKIGFYKLSQFFKYLEGQNNKALVEDMEALVFYGLRLNNKDRFLNHVPSIGNKKCREKWKQFFG